MRTCSFNDCAEAATVRPVLLVFAPKALDPGGKAPVRVLTSIVSCSDHARRIDVAYLGPQALDLVCDGLVAAGKARPDLSRTVLELIPYESEESLGFDRLVAAKGRA